MTELSTLEDKVRHALQPWPEQVRSLVNFHLLRQQSEKWTIAQTAKTFELHEQTVSQYIKLYKALGLYPHLSKCATRNSALRKLREIESKKSQSVFDSLTNISVELFDQVDLNQLPQIQPRQIKIYDTDFQSFADSYSGKLFNLVHLDGEYEHNIRTLALRKAKLLLPSAHMILWCHIQNLYPLMVQLSDLFPEFQFNPKPIIWHQSNINGNNYMSALWGSSGDRRLVRKLDLCYASPHYTDDDFSIPMLRHVLSAFVNETTVMFDPYCRQGSSPIASHDCGAKLSVGLTQGDSYFVAKNQVQRKIRIQTLEDKQNVQPTHPQQAA